METVLAHPGGHGAVGSGPGTWEALVVLATIGLVIVAGLVVSRRLELATPAELVMPLAVVSIVAALAAGPLRTIVGAWLPWALPVGVALLAGLLATSWTRWSLASLPLGGGVVAVALVGVIGGAPMLQGEPEPADAMLPLAEDASVAFVDLVDGAELEAGRHRITVEVSDASIGPSVVPADQLPGDVDQLGHVQLWRGSELVPTAADRGCTVEDPCQQVDFEVTLEPGEWELEAEFLSAEGLTFAPPVSTSATVVVR